MSKLKIALLSTLLSDEECDGLAALEQILAAGVPARSAHRELPAGPLRTRMSVDARIWEDLERTQSECREADARMLYPGHPSYPQGFSALERPPRFLNVRGAECWVSRSGFGIVGGREPSRAALDWMDASLPEALRELGGFTISGGARGVDQRAHSLSLRSGVPTVAFLPSGLKQVYPKEFGFWIDAIVASGGAVVTEFGPNVPMRKANFHRRNRLIATMGSAILVVEAARKSGSLITAHQALRAGRPIATLPASPLEPRALGALDLLFDGAQMLRDARDLVEFVRFSARPAAG